MSAFKFMDPILGRNPDLVRISNSEIQTFKHCKRKWMLGNYYGLKKIEEEFNGPLPLGVRIHEALDGYYFEGEDPQDKYNVLQNADNKRFIESGQAEFPDKLKKFNNESELGRIMLEGYTEWVAESNADADIEFISQEEALAYRPEEFGGRVEVIGKVDALIRRKYDEFLAILDFKSAQQFNDYLSAAHHSEQMPTYINLKSKSDPDAPKIDGARYRLLKKVKRSGTAKPPFYLDIDVRFNKKTLESHWKRILGTIREMVELRDRLDAGEDHQFYAYPTQKMTWECTSCPFFNGCFMLDDGSDAEGFFTDNYNQVDPNQRYNDNDKENESE